MKILLAVETDKGIESPIANRFGRAAFFLIFGTDENRVLSVRVNEFKNEGHGVGIKVANFIVENDYPVVIGAQPGPKAEQVLNRAKVRIIVDDHGTVRDVLERHKEKIAE